MSGTRKDNPFPEKPIKGSPTPGEPLYIPVGKFGRPFSFKGKVTFFPETEFQPQIRPGMILLVGREKKVLTIESVKQHGKGLLVSFGGMQTDVEAARLTNLIAYVQSDELPKLHKGEYYHHQLIGLKVIDEQGTMIGILDEILETGANDVYVVISEDGMETLLPAIKSVILKIDFEQSIMRVHPPEWESS